MKFWRNSPRLGLIQGGLVIIGALMILLGVYREEVTTVLMKAVYICLECIGIG